MTRMMVVLCLSVAVQWGPAIGLARAGEPAAAKGAETETKDTATEAERPPGSPANKEAPSPQRGEFSIWRAVGSFVLGFLWLGVCSLLGRLMFGTNCLGGLIVLVIAFGAIFSKDGLYVPGWVTGHQIGFWIGFSLALILAVVAGMSALENQSG
jgi:hypothetical protein